MRKGIIPDELFKKYDDQISLNGMNWTFVMGFHLVMICPNVEYFAIGGEIFLPVITILNMGMVKL